jgi:hypothetical protein
MAPYEVCCVLCGALVRRDPNITQDAPELRWMSKFRVGKLISRASHDCTMGIHNADTILSVIPVYYNLDDVERQAYLSGPGTRNATKDTVLVRRPTVTEPSPRKIRVDLMGSAYKMSGLSIGDGDPPEAYGFPFHEACWGVISKLWEVDHQNLQDLLRVLRSFVVQLAPYTLLKWGHDYSGFAHCPITQDETVPGEIDGTIIQMFLQSQIHSYHRHNPLDCSELRRIFKQASNAVTTIAGAPVLSNRSHANKAKDHAIEKRGLGSCFSALPAELLEMILECLPLSDVLALREVSREFVNLGLHDLFWRSRFLPARELGFAFEAQQYFSSLRGQWKSLGRAVKRIQPPPSIHGPIKHLQPPPSLVNRVRIWGLAAALRELVQKAEGSNCQGTGVAPSVSQGFSLLRRPQCERLLLIPDQPAAVFVSTITVHGRRYVSGIRVQLKGDDDGGHSVSFGYLHPVNETLLLDCEERHARWIGLHIALDSDGIRGLAAVTESGTLSAWVGDHEELIKQSLVLKSRKQEEANMLWGGFDVSPDYPSTFLTLTSNHASGQRPSGFDAWKCQDQV